MALSQDVKEQIIATLDTLPEETLAEIATYLQHLQAKRKQPEDVIPYQPVTLGGLWAGITISDEDIDETRREM